MRCLSIIIASLFAAPALAQSPRVVEVVPSELNVRASPWGAVLATASGATLLVGRREQSGFLEVDWAGRKAWVSRAYVAASPAPAVEVVAAGLNVRDAPSTSGAVIGLAHAGEAYARLGASGEWVRVQFGARAAWVHGDHVRPLAAGPAPAPAPPPAPATGGWQALHAGLTLDGVPVPRRGLTNPTLRAALGVAVEPHGAVVERDGRSFVRGRVSWFGGPRDFGVTPTETGALTGERLRALNTPLDPSAAALAQRPEDFYYAAMRFDYSPRGSAWWRGARLLVVEPQSGRAIVVRCVDWGPHTSTGRVIDLSPQALRDLGVVTDADLLVAFAAPGAPPGVVSGP